MNAALKEYQSTTTAILDQDQRNRKLLYLFTAVAGLVAVQIMHLALDDLKINAALSGGLICGFLYSYLLARRFRAITTYAISGLSVIVALRYYMAIRSEETMLGTYLAILAGILMVLLAFKAFSPADHRFILMFSVVFLLFSSVASYDLKFMLLLPMFLVFSGCSLYLANQVDVSVRVSGTAGSAFKMQLGFGQGFAGVLARAVAGIILLASIAYIVVPHTSGGNNSMLLDSAQTVDRVEEGEVRNIEENNNSSGGSENAEVGLSTEFDLRDSSRLTSDPRPVLKLRSHRAGYLRAQVFDVYTGSGWEKSTELAKDSVRQLEVLRNSFMQDTGDRSGFQVPLIDFPGESYAESLEEKQGIKVVPNNVYSTSEGDLDYDVVRQEIVLLEDQLPFYFSTYQPFKIANISHDRSNQPITLPVVDGASIIGPLREGQLHPEDFSYVIYTLEPRVSKSKLENVVGKPDERILKQYTQLPLADNPIPDELGGLQIPMDKYRSLSPRLQNFARRFDAAGEGQSGAINVWETVSGILEYLINEDEFTYSRQFIPIDGDLEITEAFVMGTQEGYCRYFASSMAVLCRMNNVPARIVTGYSPGSFSLVENAYIYKASNAHVWVEVYFNGYGWIMFDPSPTASGTTNSTGRMQWVNDTLDFLQELFVLDPASTRETIMQSLASVWAWALDHGTTSLLILAAVAGLVLIYIFAGRIRLKRRKPPLKPQNEVIAQYLSLKSALARAGHRAGPAATARSYLGEAAQRFPEIGGELEQFIPVYESAAFSGNDPAEDDVEQSRSYVRKILDFVAEFVRNSRRKK